MTKRNWALAAAAVALMTVTLATTQAWSNPRVNHLTFKGAVGLPGVTLPAGTYIFEVMVPGSQQVVRVSGKDGRHYFLGFTQTVERPRGSRTAPPLVTFGEAPAGTPPPIATWYPIGSSRGHRFLYPDASR